MSKPSKREFFVHKTTSRFKAFAAGRRGASMTWLMPLVLASTGHAAPSGMVGTIYYGSLPPDVQVACVENQTCSIKGVQEVWYGANGSWIYKLVDGGVACNNATFTDPAPGKFKACYSHDITTPEILPPTVDTIPLTFELNDLLMKSKGRFTFAVWDGGVRKPVTTNRLEINLKANKGPLRLQQNFFQFEITDGGSPIRQHNVYLSPTYNRCLVSHLSSTGNVVNTYGRIMEIYSMTSIPSTQFIPQRSDTQKICTNDKGQLSFNLRPPSLDSFQIKVVNYEAYGKPNDVFDFFIPINFEWRTTP